MKKRFVFIDVEMFLTIAGVMRNRRGDMMSKIKNYTGRTAAEILKATGQENTIPVNLGVILRKMEVSVISFDFSQFEKIMPDEVSRRGRILGAVMTAEEGRTAIFYSSDASLMSDHRYRFTVAHELAHCCLDGCTNHVEFRRDGEVNDENERRANVFAGELLIPIHQLESVSKRLLLPTVKNLAEVFEVSETVMLGRLKHLNRPDLYI